jgi:hypothetical protein
MRMERARSLQSLAVRQKHDAGFPINPAQRKRTDLRRITMHKIRIMISFISGILLVSGCSQMQLVQYGELEPTNSVEVQLKSGAKIQGTLIEAEPHQLVIKSGVQNPRTVAKVDIASIKRMPPVSDQFGNGISEEEIESVKTNKNAFIYGIGGGLLSFGASFFSGSMIANSMTESSGTILAATTCAGSGLGTVLFVMAGKNKDRSDAIDAICEDRQMSVQVKKTSDSNNQDNLQQILSDEKERQEKLREEREELLRKLQESQENKN